MTASSSRSRCSVLIDASISPERSYPGMICTPGGREGAISRSFCFTPLMTFSAFMPLTHDDDAADGFSFAIPLRDSFADIGAEAHRSQIAQQDGRSVLAADGNRSQIIQRAQIAETADHVLRPAQIEHTTADFIRAHLYLVDDRRKRNAIGEQLVGIELYLILPDEAADAGDLSNAGHGLQGIAQMPVLQAAQVGKAVLAALIDDGIFVDPACARCIGADRRMHVLGQPPADLLQIFNDTRTRPVEISAILENYVDIGVPEHRLSANCFHMRRSQQAGDDRIGHLVFDHVGRFTGPGRVDDDLHIRDVRQSVQRDMLERPDARKCEQQDCGEDQEAIARAEHR